MLGDPAPPPFDPLLLRSTRTLRALGVDPRRGGWYHVRSNAWVERAVWAALGPEQRHAALVHATDAACHEPGTHVFALDSAAAVWGLPRVGPWPAHVTVLATGPRTRGSRLVRVHVGAPTEGVVVRGLRVTGVARSVVDLARTTPFESALCAADHALRHGLCTPTELVEAAASVAPRVRGRPAARLVAALADGSSMSPGESLSRARMAQLGLPRPWLQVPREDDEGFIGWGGLRLGGCRRRVRRPPEVRGPRRRRRRARGAGALGREAARGPHPAQVAARPLVVGRRAPGHPDGAGARGAGHPAGPAPGVGRPRHPYGRLTPPLWSGPPDGGDIAPPPGDPDQSRRSGVTGGAQRTHRMRRAAPGTVGP